MNGFFSTMCCTILIIIAVLVGVNFKTVFPFEFWPKYWVDKRGKRTYQEAIGNCTTVSKYYDYHLAVMNSYSENEIKQVMNEDGALIAAFPRAQRNWAFWVGLSKSNTTDKWTWIDNVPFNGASFKKDHENLTVVTKIDDFSFGKEQLNTTNIESDIDKWAIYNEDPENVWTDENKVENVNCTVLIIRENDWREKTSDSTKDARWHRTRCIERNWAVCELGKHKDGIPTDKMDHHGADQIIPTLLRTNDGLKMAGLMAGKEETAAFLFQNRIRTNPREVQKYVRKQIARFDSNWQTIANIVNILTKDGIKGWNEAIAKLGSQATLPEMEWNDYLALAAEDHCLQMGRQGLTGHKGIDGTNPWDRMERYGDWGGSTAENIAYVHR